MLTTILIYATVVSVMSAITFIAYGLDKRRAKNGGRRIPEARSHLLALLGGWPGALAGQQFFRHKTQKVRFQLITWAIVGLHAVVGLGILYLLFAQEN